MKLFKRYRRTLLVAYPLGAVVALLFVVIVIGLPPLGFGVYPLFLLTPVAVSVVVVTVAVIGGFVSAGFTDASLEGDASGRAAAGAAGSAAGVIILTIIFCCMSPQLALVSLPLGVGVAIVAACTATLTMKRADRRAVAAQSVTPDRSAMP